VNFFKSVNIWQSYKQERDCLSLSSSFSSVLARCACNFAKYSPIKNFTHTLSNKFFLICLLTAQPQLKYIATVPCNLSLMACFADLNVSQGSVATTARCGGMFNMHLTVNLHWNLPVKKYKSVKI